MSKLAIVAGVLAILVGAASAQAPKTGDYYTDDTDLGFRVKMPKGWGFFPPKPGQGQHVIGKYDGDSVQISPEDRLGLSCYLVKFDRRPGEDGKPKKVRYEDVSAWINSSFVGAWREEKSKDFRVSGIDATEFTFNGKIGKGPVNVYAAVFSLTEEVQVAMVATGPGEKKWSKYYSAYRKMAKTFKRVEVEVVEETGTGAGSVREQKRRRLQDEASRTPGWRLLETENYFVITNSDDTQFIKELMSRIEAIRAVYEVDYPPDEARQAKDPDEDAGGDDDEDEEEDENRTVSVQADPMELSRTSVVRVCANREAYLGYGAPSGSGGYWSPGHEELVVYNKKQEQGEDATWETLSHEAFHQYIFYFYGSLSPHSWYNEGTGDYYGGHEYKRKKFVRAPRQMRKDTIKELVREEKTAPLKEFVRWNQSQYYGNNGHGLSGFECYGQGWSLIYFLRLGKKVRGWNSQWDGILSVYLDALVDTGDLDEAVDKAFAGVDWQEFEDTWKNFIKKQL